MMMMRMRERVKMNEQCENEDELSNSDSHPPQIVSA